MWVWKSDLWRARNKGYTHVSWGPANLNLPRIITITIQDFLNAVAAKSGKIVQTPKSWYIAFPLTIFQAQQTTNTGTVAQSVNTMSTATKKQRKKSSVLTNYQIVPRTDGRFGIEAVRGAKKKHISKIFNTRAEAASYIRGALRRPNFMDV